MRNLDVTASNGQNQGGVAPGAVNRKSLIYGVDFGASLEQEVHHAQVALLSGVH